MSSSNIASFLVVFLVASCVLNSEAACSSDNDCKTECPQGGFCHVETGVCVCLPTTSCVVDSDCVQPCGGSKIHKCQGGHCVCQ
ncbi:hypothetical protein V6N13_029562 [Hibiscus sabdariffa]|uniref:Uncharacterized protein n=1 Tax=Hibiscus sabdariffa TaxID=183260 RepID=A0ABR2T9K5_9ROSI